MHKFSKNQIKEAQLIFDRYSWSYDLEGINQAKNSLITAQTLSLELGNSVEEISNLLKELEWAIMVLGSQLELRKLSEEELKTKTGEIFGATFKPSSESFETQMKSFIDKTFNEEENILFQMKSKLQSLLGSKVASNHQLVGLAIEEIQKLEAKRNIPTSERFDSSWTDFIQSFRFCIEQIEHLRDDNNFIDSYEIAKQEENL